MHIYYQSVKYTVKVLVLGSGEEYHVVDNATGKEMILDDAPAADDQSIDALWDDYTNMVLNNEIEEHYHVAFTDQAF